MSRYAPPIVTRPAPPDRRPIWVRREGDYVVVLIEENGEWREVIRDVADGPFSHIWEDRT